MTSVMCLRLDFHTGSIRGFSSGKFWKILWKAEVAESGDGIF